MDEHPFARLRAASQVGGPAERDSQYEAMLVRFLLLQLGEAKQSALLEDDCRRATGTVALRLAFFNRRFEDFPLLLGAARLQFLHAQAAALWPSIFKAFEKTPFSKAYEEFLAEHGQRASGRAVGLVFPRRGFRYGLVVYNGGLDTYFESQLDAHVHRRRRRDGRIVERRVQSFESVVKALCAARTD